MSTNKHLDEMIDVGRDLARPEAAGDDAAKAYSRRSFLKGGMAATAAVVMPFEILGKREAAAASLPYSPDYGPVAPVVDGTTGLPLLRLPDGFTYRSYGWTRDVMADGIPTPGAHDGMAVCGQDASRIVLIRNHELTAPTGSFGPAKITYDPAGIGGCTTLHFNPRTGQWITAYASIAGTINNCAGGPTPWGSWITCEENTSGPLTNPPGYTKQHGYCFEIPAFGATNPAPLTAMGAFVHEAIAVDPVTGIVYLTEDQTNNTGFYRFIPDVKTRLAQGGQLQMLKVVGVYNANLIGSTTTGLIPAGTTCDVEWVAIADPLKAYATAPTSSGQGVVQQGFAQGGARFTRGEGAWYGNGVIYWISTSGGIAGQGQVWKYDPRRETLTMIYESPGVGTLNSPDNCAWSPRGSLILCEDGGRSPQMLHGLTQDGTIFKFCENNVELAGFKGFTGNFRNREFAGATFHNEWLFVNIQDPGVTFAITGPWDNGAL